MTVSKEIQLVRMKDVEGFQHAHDTYWSRPIIFSDRLFTYVTHVPPGGEMPAHEDAHTFDTVLYMLKGELEITYGKEKFPMEAHMALHTPGGVPFGVKNHGDITASFVLTFNPPPDVKSLEEWRQRYIDRGREDGILTAEEMNEMIGDTLD